MRFLSVVSCCLVETHGDQNLDKVTTSLPFFFVFCFFGYGLMFNMDFLFGGRYCILQYSEEPIF